MIGIRLIGFTVQLQVFFKGGLISPLTNPVNLLQQYKGSWNNVFEYVQDIAIELPTKFLGFMKFGYSVILPLAWSSRKSGSQLAKAKLPRLISNTKR
jgi:hypothetical protein